ncbi:MAG: hypothetical protein RDU13_03105 [Elusimicrobiales bacterium]|nr:hypothetical protein [Elusimicrobiales bacterium]
MKRIFVVLCAVLLAGCAGIPARKAAAPALEYRAAKVLFLPNMCGAGGDPATGNFNLPYPGLRLPPGSPAPSYTPGYNSLGGFAAGGAALEPQSDGSVILTLSDGTRILFVPAGALDPELTGDLDQFNYPPGYNSVLTYIGGGYTLKDKDGTVTHFESVPYAGFSCEGPVCPSFHRVSRQVDRNGEGGWGNFRMSDGRRPYA